MKPNGIRYGTGSPPPILEPSDDTVPFVRATDIKEGEIKTGGLLHIAKKQPERLEKCRLLGDELIVVRSGVNTGDCAVVPRELAGAYAAYDLIVQFKPEVMPRFVSTFLDTPLGRVQLNLLKGRAAQPHINAEELGSIELPLPSVEVQSALVTKFEGARASRKQKLAQADELLNGLDGWLLEQLGFALPSTDERKIFAVRLGQAQERFDTQHHLPRFKQMLNTITHAQHYSLGSLVSFSEELWSSKEAEERGKTVFCYIEISGVDRRTGNAYAEEVLLTKAPSRARMVVRRGDIIISLTRPHHGSIARIDAPLDGCIASTGFAVVRSYDAERINHDYLWAVLRTQLCLQQMLQRSSGGNYPAITKDELGKILVPVPSLEIQEHIVDEVFRRQVGVQRLHIEAETDWEAAKQHFENQLLGGK